MTKVIGKPTRDEIEKRVRDTIADLVGDHAQTAALTTTLKSLELDDLDYCDIESDIEMYLNVAAFEKPLEQLEDEKGAPLTIGDVIDYVASL